MKSLEFSQSKVQETAGMLPRRVWWYIGGAFLAAFALGLTLYLSAPEAAAQTQGLDCISCHTTKPLAYHDKLSQGNKLCWSCHDAFDMKRLRLADGTLIPRAESPRLCGQCHQQRYTAWQEGTHGIPGTVATGTCTQCHDPHRPQMSLLGITKPHPDATPPPPPAPRKALMIIGGSILFLAGLGVILAKRGK